MVHKKRTRPNLSLSAEISGAIDRASESSKRTATLALHKLKNLYNREKDSEHFHISDRDIANDLGE